MGWGCHPVGGSDTESVTPNGGEVGRRGPAVQLCPAYGVFIVLCGDQLCPLCVYAQGVWGLCGRVPHGTAPRYSCLMGSDVSQYSPSAPCSLCMCGQDPEL